MDIQPFHCTKCEFSLASADEVVSHIALRHADGVPPHELKSWFEVSEKTTIPQNFITEAGGDRL